LNIFSITDLRWAMTLDARLARRLREWQQRGRKLQDVLSSLRPGDEASPMLEKELATLRQCIADLAADLYARNGRSPSSND
jgi:hypothetical protein